MNIHIIGVCGVATGALACMLKEIGHNVSGSDANMYPPMISVLKKSQIILYDKYNEANIKSPDLVIVGNAISRENVELEYVLNERFEYISMPEAIKKFFLKSKEVIAVCGTHGKTTTTALLAHILICAKLDPSFFVGGVTVNYNSNFKLGSGTYFIIEGDEYDSAYFEKFPKFIKYQPHHAVLTSLEFDHADIYANIDEIKKWFKHLLNIISSKGIVVYSNEYSGLSEIISTSMSICKSFGLKAADYNFKFIEHSKHLSKIELASEQGVFTLETEIFGDFNYSNICSAAAMAIELGIDKNVIIEAVKTFKGVKRRQEVLIESKNMIIYDDFAHHPTAISNVLESMRLRYPNSQIWAIYEPRSATSKRNIFQAQLPQAFSSAQTVILMQPSNMNKIADKERLDINYVYNELILQGKDAWLFDNSDEIVNKIIYEPKEKHTVAVIMSNGEFDGLYDKIYKLKDNLY